MSTPTNMMRVKPATEMWIANPERGFRPLRETGELVPRTGYWLNRLAEGGVVLVPDALPPESPPPPAKKSKAAV